MEAGSYMTIGGSVPPTRGVGRARESTAGHAAVVSRERARAQAWHARIEHPRVESDAPAREHRWSRRDGRERARAQCEFRWPTTTPLLRRVCMYVRTRGGPRDVSKY